MISHEQRFARPWRKACDCPVQDRVDWGHWPRLEMWLVLPCTWQEKQIKSQMYVTTPCPYHIRIFPGPPTRLPLNPWPLTAHRLPPNPAPFFSVATVTSQPFSISNDLLGWLPESNLKTKCIHLRVNLTKPRPLLPRIFLIPLEFAFPQIIELATCHSLPESHTIAYSSSKLCPVFFVQNNLSPHM